VIAGRVRGPETREEDIAALVDSAKRAPDRRDVLVELLLERDPVYAGRGTNATTRMRGYILAAFESVGLPDAALPYVIEELESGRDAYLVAAAAKAARGLDAPVHAIVPFLLRAIDNVRDVDDAVTFETYLPTWPRSNSTTALGEILRTLAWLGPEAREALPRLTEMAHGPDTFSAATRQAITEAVAAIGSTAEAVQPIDHCCEHPVGDTMSGQGALEGHHDQHASSPSGVELEDQDGRTLTYGDFFARRPSVVAFFYTRCTNPNKCSLTITKLARVQRAIGQQGLTGRLRTAAITYDPGFDLPPRLRAYGENRGFVFDADHRFLRSPVGFAALDEYFQLGVSFGPAVVNRHRIELFILDKAGGIAATFARRLWDEDAVLEHAASLLD
jgi:protein SCO1/2